MKKQIAVFASGSGSNYQAIMEYIEQENCQFEVALLVCDKPGAKVIKRAEAYRTPVHVFQPGNYQSKADFEKEILTKLQEAHIELVVLAGYMRLIGATLLSAYERRVINIHPSLLPAFPGKDAIGQAIDAGVRVAGVTVHYVDSGMDTGEIIDQEALKLNVDETKESLQQRIQKIEHQLYPKTINWLLAPVEGEKLNL